MKSRLKTLFGFFSTLDLISNGRAEIVVGRGSFTESYPLFGLSLNDYDELFAEKLDLLLKIRDNELKKIPYMLIVGEQEEMDGKVAVRKHGEGDLGTYTAQAFAQLINEQIAKDLAVIE